MRRAVETAVLLLEGYSNSLEWKILPWFREILLSQCDFGYYTHDYLKEHPYIDASELGDDRLWQLNYYIETDRQHASKLREAYQK